MRTKTGTSYRLSESTLRLIDLLAENTGLSKTGVIEQAVRLMAKREGISIKKEEATS
jgi:predicted transcriptional regulator